jgi:hypothetical protein
MSCTRSATTARLSRDTPKPSVSHIFYHTVVALQQQLQNARDSRRPWWPQEQKILGSNPSHDTILSTNDLVVACVL